MIIDFITSLTCVFIAIILSKNIVLMLDNAIHAKKTKKVHLNALQDNGYKKFLYELELSLNCNGICLSDEKDLI